MPRPLHRVEPLHPGFCPGWMDAERPGNTPGEDGRMTVSTVASPSAPSPEPGECADRRLSIAIPFHPPIGLAVSVRTETGRLPQPTPGEAACPEYPVATAARSPSPGGGRFPARRPGSVSRSGRSDLACRPLLANPGGIPPHCARWRPPCLRNRNARARIPTSFSSGPARSRLCRPWRLPVDQPLAARRRCTVEARAVDTLPCGGADNRAHRQGRAASPPVRIAFR